MLAAYQAAPKVRLGGAERKSNAGCLAGLPLEEPQHQSQGRDRGPHLWVLGTRAAWCPRLAFSTGAKSPVCLFNGSSWKVPMKVVQGLDVNRTSKGLPRTVWSLQWESVFEIEFLIRDPLSLSGLDNLSGQVWGRKRGVLFLFLMEAPGINCQRISLPFSIKKIVSERCP